MLPSARCALELWLTAKKSVLPFPSCNTRSIEPEASAKPFWFSERKFAKGLKAREVDFGMLDLGASPVGAA